MTVAYNRSIKSTYILEKKNTIEIKKHIKYILGKMQQNSDKNPDFPASLKHLKTFLQNLKLLLWLFYGHKIAASPFCLPITLQVMKYKTTQ